MDSAGFHSTFKNHKFVRRVPRHHHPSARISAAPAETNPEITRVIRRTVIALGTAEIDE